MEHDQHTLGGTIQRQVVYTISQTCKYTVDMIQLTQRAREKMLDFLVETGNPDSRIRVYIVGGGCAGLTYGFSMEEDFSEDDFLIDFGSAKVVIDSTSAQYIEGSTVDYEEKLWESKFTVDNPNAVTSCGCGSSFLPRDIN